ncbi:MAG: tRNA (adenine-N1)-methyltransferase [Synergistales bacterium]|nr:tRNA (adenine-N1)-methyltransferase [Synergistales bacterium]
MMEPGTLVVLWSPRKGDSFIVRLREGASLGSHLGKVGHDEIMEQGFGDAVTTHTGNRLYLLRPQLGGFVRRLKRQTQIVYPKEAGYLLLHLGIAPGARVLECGTGSGALTTVFAHFVGDGGRVYSYDKRQNFTELAMANCCRWGVEDRVTFKVREVEEGFDERDVDALFLDVPKPWECLETAAVALAPGARIGILVPTVNQIDKTLQGFSRLGFVDVDVVEILERHYKTNPARLRPEDVMVGHTGFLVFASRVVADEQGGSGEPDREEPEALSDVEPGEGA